jgi:hypothetical protein
MVGQKGAMVRFIALVCGEFEGLIRKKDVTPNTARRSFCVGNGMAGVQGDADFLL